MLLLGGLTSFFGTAATTHRAKTTKPKPASLSLLIEPDNGQGTLAQMVDNATKTIDMTMYELVDTDFSGRLVAACARGVRVRVILDQNLEKANNLPAFQQLNAQPGCTAAWANPQFQATHQKSLIVDGATLAILTFNLTSRFYPTARDFGIIEQGATDIAAVQKTFNADFGSTTSFSFKPPAGADLLWSPTTAQAGLLSIISGARKTLLVENEELLASNIVAALQSRCREGVDVRLTMTSNPGYLANQQVLTDAGCAVHLYPNTATGLYIHAKAMVADFGMPTQRAYVGSINFSTASMTQNRELGLTFSDTTAITRLQSILAADFLGGTPLNANPAFDKDVRNTTTNPQSLDAHN